MTEDQGAHSAPAIVLIDPKYPSNVGAAVRACACYGVARLIVVGARVPLTPHPGYRLPREERLRSYQRVKVEQVSARPFDLLGDDIVPVAVERRNAAEALPVFVHPARAVYVFGPEDGDLDKGILSSCHRFVRIPARHALNLSAAVYTVLYDRMAKGDGAAG